MSKKKQVNTAAAEHQLTTSAVGPKILFFGDPHGGFAPVFEGVQKLQPTAIVLLGDLQPQRPLHLELASILSKTKCFLFRGNHDTDSDANYENLFQSELADRNLHGRVELIGGYSVACLGGVLRDKVWSPDMPSNRAVLDSAEKMASHARRGRHGSPGDVRTSWRGGILRKHHSSIFPNVYEQMRKMKADILVSHEAPSAHSHGFAAIDKLAIGLGAKLVVHGHHHESIDYLAAGLIPSGLPFLAHGVDKGAFLALPPKEST